MLGWRVSSRANICGPLDGGMVTLQFDANSFHTDFVAHFIRLKLNFIEQTKKFFEPPFGDLRVTYAPYL